MQLNGKAVDEIIVKEKEDLANDRLAAVGQIAAGIAHEVRNPLASVKGFLQLLKEEQPHEYLDIAYEQLENALDTMQNLLNVSKPDMEDEKYYPINLSSELESILYLFQDKVYEVQVNKEFRDVHTTIYGKKNQLKKALFNLLKNAFEAIKGTGSITIKHFVDQNQLVISISDTGVGVPKDKLKLLGTPFFTSKESGTGMGLTQVYTTVYDHQGVIKVHSEINVGTTFTLYFPIPIKQELGVVKLNLMFEENQEFKEFYLTNQKKFADLLSEEGSSVFERMKETNDFDNQFLLAATHKIILLLNDTDEYGLIMHAKEHGRNWAELNLELILIMEWFQTFRKLYWDFIYNYYENKQVEHKEFFELERLVNYKLDTYLKHFASSFSEYTQQVILSQNELIDDLSVPIIPISNEMAILPIVGSVDTRRAKNIQLKSLEQIHKQNFQHIIIDLSGVAYMDTGVLDHLFNIVNGIRIQGCQTVLTGIRPEITNTIVELGIDLHEKVETKGTLQQAIADYNVSILKS